MIPFRFITPLTAALLLVASTPAAAQQPVPGSGHIIVLAEPGAITLPPGLTRLPADQAQVGVARVREVFARHGLSAIRRASPHWDEFRASAPTARVYARRKNELMPPDALADLSLLYVLEFPDAVNVAAVVAELNAAEGIVYAEPDRPIRSLAIRGPAAPPADAARTALSPNDPLFVQGLNWGFNGTWGVNALAAWDIQAGQAATRIAIFDSGIETTHPDFVGRIADQYDFVNGDGDAYPDLDQDAPYHGLAVTGVAAAQTNDGFGSAGLCGGFAPANPGCSILAAKTLGSLSTWQLITEWLGLTSMVADATSWALARQAKVINNSWCQEVVNRSVHDAFRNAYLSNALVTAAVGNTEFIQSKNRWKCDQDTPSKQVAPAAFGDILMAVGATNANGDRVVQTDWQSAYGPAVVAPGIGHYSDSLGGSTSWFGGTSEATPFVSGLAGLISSEAAAKGIAFTAWDVRQLIENTARQKPPTPPGHNSQTGWGIIDAAKALQVLQPPNQLAFVTLGSVPGAQCYARTGVTNWTFWASWATIFANRCEIRYNITFAKRYAAPPIVWGRPVAGGGVTPSNPNSEIFFTGVVPGSVTTTGATLRTYVYERWSLGGTYQGWWPAAPDQVGFGYAVLGQVAPFSVTASAPGFVTVKSTYSLTGSASDPASGWQWDRSYDGGPFSFWASGQNSSFIAYAGNYTLDWRLSATRNFDGAGGTGYAQTRVCVPYNPSTCAAAIAAGGDVRSTVTMPGTTALHFGSGIWIGFPQGPGGTVLRSYSFSGAHDTATGGTVWPNIVERDGGQWTYLRTPAGRVELTARRYPAGADRQLLRITGRLSTGRAQDIAIGLASDPDFGEPSDDTIGFEPDLGLAWAGDRAEGRYIGYLSFDAGTNARLRQFGSTAGEEPSSPDAAYAAMTGESRFTPERPDDVRLLLTAPAVAADASGRFRTTFAVLRATSLAALQALADSTRTAAATLLAGLPADDADVTPRGDFVLRQRVAGSGMTASLTGEGGGASASANVSALQAAGITALDYSVPDGRDVEVHIRIYSSTGQLVRTLVRQRLGGGQYHVEWDLLNERGQRVAPGVYVAVMEAVGFRATRKLVVTR